MQRRDSVYKVVKQIPKERAWEVEAQVGDLLVVGAWNGLPTLMKGDLAVCDVGSETEKEYCERVQEG